MNEVLSQQFIERIVSEVTQRVFVKIEASGRHVHLSRDDVEKLFGPGYQLTKTKELSQPGQFVCKEKVTVTGPKGSIAKVAVLGPERKETQVEISMTDALALGIPPVVRQSGDTKDTPGAVLSNGDQTIRLLQGVIIAKRHIHLQPDDAKRFGVSDGETVAIQVFGGRGVTFDEVAARVHKDFRTYAHIDYDEANACGYQKNMLGMIRKLKE